MSNEILIILNFLLWSSSRNVETRYKNKGLVNHVSLKFEESAPFSYTYANVDAHTLSVRPSDRSQIGLESSESKKCSQRLEIDHFC